MRASHGDHGHERNGRAWGSHPTRRERAQIGTSTQGPAFVFLMRHGPQDGPRSRSRDSAPPTARILATVALTGNGHPHGVLWIAASNILRPGRQRGLHTKRRRQNIPRWGRRVRCARPQRQKRWWCSGPRGRGAGASRISSVVPADVQGSWRTLGPPDRPVSRKNWQADRR